MRSAPAGYTHLEDAEEKWGEERDGKRIRTRNWWYNEVKEGRLIAYVIAGESGRFLRDADVEAFLLPKPEAHDDMRQTG